MNTPLVIKVTSGDTNYLAGVGATTGETRRSRASETFPCGAPIGIHSLARAAGKMERRRPRIQVRDIGPLIAYNPSTENYVSVMTMIPRPSERLLFGTIVAFFVIASVGALAWIFFPNYVRGPAGVGIGHTTRITDLSNDRKLAGYGESIFFGQVAKELGQSEERGWPETQFSVKILEVLKGSVTGEETVNQQGGFNTRKNSTFRMTDDPNLLEPGKSYLFVTRPLERKGWHTLISGYGNIEIRVSKHATKNEVLGSKHAGELRERFTDAVEHQIPFDIRNP